MNVKVMICSDQNGSYTYIYIFFEETQWITSILKNILDYYIFVLFQFVKKEKENYSINFAKITCVPIIDGRTMEALNLIVDQKRLSFGILYD